MADNVRRILASLRIKAAKVARDLAVEITANLMETTPVDTGWARANWTPSLDHPVGNHAKTGEAGAAAATQSAAIASLVSSKPALRVYYVANGVPYIGTLNRGHSRQAPAGFVQLAIFRGVAAVRAKLANRRYR